MENSLVKRIGRGIFKIGAPLLIGGLSLINSGCNTTIEHNIDGKTIVTPLGKNYLSGLFNGDLVIGKDKIYINSSKINSMHVPGFGYKLSNKTHEDSVVINEAQKKVDYYLNKIDSTNKAERIKTGLEALK